MTVSSMSESQTGFQLLISRSKLVNGKSISYMPPNIHKIQRIPVAHETWYSFCFVVVCFLKQFLEQ